MTKKMNLFENFKNYFSGSPVKTTNLYEAINWDKSYIGGSYALKKFRKDDWEHHDIDVFMDVVDENDFEKEAKKFEDKIDCKLIKKRSIKDGKFSTYIDEYGKEFKIENSQVDEDFHESIVGTKTYKMGTHNEPVQLVGMVKNKMFGGYKFTSFVSYLNYVTDNPACVLFKVYDNKKVFTIPEKGVKCAITGECSKDDICSDRIEKYKKRGFEFN
jgi:hypothetical protein